MVEVFRREICRLCDSKDVELVVKLEPIPLSEIYSGTEKAAKAVSRYPVNLYMCATCGHVQQLDVVDAKSLWKDYTYLSGRAKGMLQHFENVVEEIVNIYQPPGGALVVDVGSNDGSLLKSFKKAGYRVLGVDPAKEIARHATESGIKTIPEFMSNKLANKIRGKYGPAHVVCVFNAFAHTDDMGDMVESIRTLISDDGLFFFEVQYLLDVIDGMLIGTIFHEHMSHHSVTALAPFLERHGMELIDIKRVSIQHGSLIGTVQIKGGGRPVNKSVKDLIALESEGGLSNLETLRQFSNKLNQLKKQTSELVQSWKKSGLSIAGYGAARSGPTLISQFGLTGMIDYIVDDHPQKVKKYSAGDGIKIIPTEELLKRMPDYTIILAWVHAIKIIEDNSEYIDKGGHFLVLCPEARLVGREGILRRWRM